MIFLKGIIILLINLQMSTTTRTCVILMAGIYLGFCSSLAIAALVVSSKDGSNKCIAKYNGIDFSYSTYLDIFGWTTIGISIYNFVVLVGTICTDNVDNTKAFVIFPNILFFVFDFTWYIVGAVLYFKEVDQNCGTDMIRQFGLALFIIKTIIWASICCAKNDSTNTANSNSEV